MMELISNILGAIGNFFKWKSSGVAQRNAAKKMVSEEEELRRERHEAVNRAVHEGDADRVNAIASGVLVLVAMLGMMGIVAMMGCVSTKPQTVYVAADRVITCTTNEEGRAVMWHVPPLVMEDLLNSKVELDELKRENKIKEITK
jgi:hypothetical protein